MYTGQTIVICERGINGWQSIFGDWNQWPNLAIAWIHKHTPHKSQTLLYFASFLFAGLTRKARAKQLSRLIRAYSTQDWRIVGISHSEGTATILRALRYAGWPRVEKLHLICGACDSDFRRNGLSWALSTGAIGEVHVWIAGEDHAMKWEDLVLGKLFFGIPERSRPLGLNGPRNVEAKISPKVIVHREPPWEDYGHSDCWLPAHFDGTIRALLSA